MKKEANREPEKTAIGYIRVSTQSQAAEGVSLEAQREKIAAWCSLNDCRLADTFTDAGISGRRTDTRPGLQAAVDLACKQRAALVIYSLSRLSRNTRETLAMAERLDKAGADLVSLSERIDTTTAAGKVAFRLMAVFSEFEADLVSERTAAALNHLRGQGRRISGHLPYGFDLAPDGQHLVANKPEQRVIKKILNWRESGLSLGKIAAELHRRRIKSKLGCRTWAASAVSAVIKRELTVT